MKRHLSQDDLYLRVMSAVLFLSGAMMLFTDISSVIAFAVIAIGAALLATALVHVNHRGGTAR